MDESLLEEGSVERSTELKSFRKELSAEEISRSCLYDGWTSHTVEVLEYSRDMPDGGTRKLVIREDGMVKLLGKDLVLEMLDATEDGCVSYSTSYDAVDQDLRYFPNLSAYHNQNYDELDEFIGALEVDSGISCSMT